MLMLLMLIFSVSFRGEKVIQRIKVQPWHGAHFVLLTHNPVQISRLQKIYHLKLLSLEP